MSLHCSFNQQWSEEVIHWVTRNLGHLLSGGGRKFIQKTVERSGRWTTLLVPSAWMCCTNLASIHAAMCFASGTFLLIFHALFVMSLLSSDKDFIVISHVLRVHSACLRSSLLLYSKLSCSIAGAHISPCSFVHHRAVAHIAGRRSTDFLQWALFCLLGGHTMIAPSSTVDISWSCNQWKRAIPWIGLQVCEALHNHVKHAFAEDYARRAAAITAEEASQGYGSFPVDDIEYSNKQVRSTLKMQKHFVKLLSQKKSLAASGGRMEFCTSPEQ